MRCSEADLLVLQVESSAQPVKSPSLSLPVTSGRPASMSATEQENIYAKTEMNNQTNLHLVAELLAVHDHRIVKLSGAEHLF